MTPPSPDTSSRARVTVSIAFLLLLGITATSLWFALVSPDPLPIDSWWNTHVVATVDTWQYGVAVALHVIGATPGTAGLTVALMLVLLVLRQVRAAFVLGFTMLSVVAVSAGLKELLQRPRPGEMLVDQHGWSFPSGHSLGAATLAGTIVVIAVVAFEASRRVVAVLVVLGSVYTLAMMWSRTALHVHWLSDTLVGAALGIALALLAANFLAPRKLTRPPR